MVVEDDSVCGGQVDSQTTSPRTEQEHKDVGSRAHCSVT